MRTLRSAATGRMPLTEARLRSGAEPCTVVHACALLISFIHFFHFFLPPPPPSYPSLLFLVDGTADQDSPCALSQVYPLKGAYTSFPLSLSHCNIRSSCAQRRLCLGQPALRRRLRPAAPGACQFNGAHSRVLVSGAGAGASEPRGKSVMKDHCAVFVQLP